MPKDKYFNGVDWTLMDSQDSDTVDGIDLRINGEILEISDDGGSTWSPVSMSAADVLAALITVDGEGSGLDADKVDGINFYKGTTTPTGTTRLNMDGYFYATKVYNAVFNDLAEFMDKGEEDLEPGQILIWDEEKGGLSTTDIVGDKRIVGVYSDSYGFALGGSEGDESKVPIGISGRVWVKVKTEVKNGDGLITSKDRGYAETGEDININHLNCRLKAMESFSPTEEGQEKRIMCIIL